MTYLNTTAHILKRNNTYTLQSFPHERWEMHRVVVFIVMFHMCIAGKSQQGIADIDSIAIKRTTLTDCLIAERGLLQMEICMNDFRTNPAKYKSAVSGTCSWDTAMQSYLSQTRLPLRGTGNDATTALDK